MPTVSADPSGQVIAYLTPDSIEQRIGQILNEKRALFADIVENVTTASLRRLDLPALLRALDGQQSGPIHPPRHLSITDRPSPGSPRPA